MLLTLTPASLSWSPLFVGYYCVLSQRIVNGRIATKTAVGDGSDPAKSVNIPESWYGKDPPKLSEAERKDALQRLHLDVRAHTLFNEYVPFGYLTIALAELNGMPTAFVHSALGLLLGLRVAHGELGLKGADAMGAGRPIGIFGTLGLYIAVGAYNFRLAWPALKRFLGQN